MRQFEKPPAPLTGRRPVPAAAVIAVTAAALLTGCGSQATGSAGSAGSAGGSGAPTASVSAGPCGVPSAPPTGGAQAPEGLARDGVRITAVSPVCAEYEVTNPGTEPYDVTVLFSLAPAGPDSARNVPRTAVAVAPGATVKDRIDLPAAGPARPGTVPKVRILKVRSVPTAEAPHPDGPCPASGLRVYTDDGDAAMGLRVAGLHLRNCGTAAVALDGYPTLQLLDEGHRPVDGVRLQSGGAGIATGTGADNPPEKISLRPGEGARAALVWRNTTGDGTAVNAPYVRVRATPGAAPVMVVPELDLGTTGSLGVGAWAREDANAAPPATRPPGPGLGLSG
ncbi:DUF4232 domain-containing protein [Kitasatospora sp. NPDC056446]|uniref:DUF4232 domain-containing protein n=1 Tax=Kitasatospora sp. NPDC056446 TaxID=3345819 RepID=UPI003675699A